MANTHKLNLDTSLPIYKKRQTIEGTISNHPITILTAETGAGKSTQVPLWLWQKGLKVNVTQPRRIATRSLSHYLSRLIHIPLGKAVGYQTGFDSRRSKDTSLLYVTDGVQMVQEIGGDVEFQPQKKAGNIIIIKIPITSFDAKQIQDEVVSTG